MGGGYTIGFDLAASLDASPNAQRKSGASEAPDKALGGWWGVFTGRQVNFLSRG